MADCEIGPPASSVFLLLRLLDTTDGVRLPCREPSSSLLRRRRPPGGARVPGGKSGSFSSNEPSDALACEREMEEILGSRFIHVGPSSGAAV